MCARTTSMRKGKSAPRAASVQLPTFQDARLGPQPPIPGPRLQPQASSPCQCQCQCTPRDIAGRPGPRRAADGSLPHLLRGRREEQVAIDVTHQPRGFLELGLELSRTPAGIADDEPGVALAGWFQQSPQQVRRRGERRPSMIGMPLNICTSSWREPTSIQLLRLHRSANPYFQLALGRTTARIERRRLTTTRPLVTSGRFITSPNAPRRCACIRGSRCGGSWGRASAAWRAEAPARETSWCTFSGFV